MQPQEFIEFMRRPEPTTLGDVAANFDAVIDGRGDGEICLFLSECKHTLGTMEFQIIQQAIGQGGGLYERVQTAVHKTAENAADAGTFL